jgi:hypothetical protein
VPLCTRKKEAWPNSRLGEKATQWAIREILKIPTIISFSPKSSQQSSQSQVASSSHRAPVRARGEVSRRRASEKFLPRSEGVRLAHFKEQADSEGFKGVEVDFVHRRRLGIHLPRGEGRCSAAGDEEESGRDSSPQYGLRCYAEVVARGRPPGHLLSKASSPPATASHRRKVNFANLPVLAPFLAEDPLLYWVDSVVVLGPMAALAPTFLRPVPS